MQKELREWLCYKISDKEFSKYLIKRRFYPHNYSTNYDGLPSGLIWLESPPDSTEITYIEPNVREQKWGEWCTWCPELKQLEKCFLGDTMKLTDAVDQTVTNFILTMIKEKSLEDTPILLDYLKEKEIDDRYIEHLECTCESMKHPEHVNYKTGDRFCDLLGVMLCISVKKGYCENPFTKSLPEPYRLIKETV